MSEKAILAKLAKATIEGNEVLARLAAEEAIVENIDITKAIREGLAEGMRELGERYERFDCFLPELMLAADAMKAALDILRPKLAETGGGESLKGKVVIGTVLGDIHDIGMELVAMALTVSGYEVINLGKDVPPRDFIKRAEEEGANFIALSCLVSPSMYYQKDVIELLKAMGIREKYHVLVGGGPITTEWTAKIGADGYGKYAEDAVKVCDELVGIGKSPGSGEPIIVGL